MIPILYDKNEKMFRTLGLGTLTDMKSCIVTEERNGLFTLEFDYPIDGKLYHEIQQENIIEADAGHKLKNQHFVIIRITKTLNGTVKVYCEHISQYKTKNTMLDPSVSFSGNAFSALSSWNENLLDDEKFIVYSNIDTQKTGEFVISKIENARKALGGTEGSILDLYGGEYEFDNLKISLLKSRGSDNGVRINYGKNLVNLEEDMEIESTITSIMPYATKYETINNKAVERTITLPEMFIDCQNIANFAYRKIARKNFTEDVETVEDLRRITQAYIKNNNIGEPKIHIKLSHIDLSKTIEYQGKAAKEELNLCDFVYVNAPKHGIHDLRAKVVKVKWNVLLDRYETLEIGTLGSRFYSHVSGVKQLENKINEQFLSVYQKAETALASADGKNINYYAETAPIANNVGDTWFKDNLDGTVSSHVWNGTEWVATDNSQIVKEQIEENNQKIEDMQEQAQREKEQSDQRVQSLEDEISSMISQIVKKYSLIGEINIQAGKTIFRQSDNVLILDSDTFYMPDSTIKTAHIKDAAITNAKIGDVDIKKLTVSDRAYFNNLIANYIDANTITAKVATLGGFIISDTNIRSLVNPSGVQLDFHNGSQADWRLMNITKNGATLAYIDQNGKFYSKNAEIEGIIRASQGTIAGWTIIGNTIKTESEAGYVKLNNIATGWDIFEAGNSTGKKFRITNNGEMVCTGGTISGWTITNNTIRTQSGNNYLRLNNAGTGYNIIEAGNADSMVFKVSPTGYLTCSGASLGGTHYGAASLTSGRYAGSHSGYGSFSSGSYTGSGYFSSGSTLAGYSVSDSGSGVKFGHLTCDSLSVVNATAYASVKVGDYYLSRATSDNNAMWISSDIREKNVLGIVGDEFLDDIYNLQIINYTMKNDPLKIETLGVNANLVNHVMSEGFIKHTVIKDDITDRYRFNYQALIPMSIKAIQDLNNRVKSLEEQNRKEKEN